MQLFIKAAEVWQPDATGRALRLCSGYYGSLTEFEATSKIMSFEYGVGLPGQTWAVKRPLVWTNLDDDVFKRSEAAKQAGIKCGASIPIHVGDFLLAVVVLFCGRSDEVKGAVEVWVNQDSSDTELKLSDGYYGELERFEWISRRLTVMKGRGLPGAAWASACPMIMNNLGESSSFLRARKAAEAGITTGLAIPFFDPESNVQIMTLLSARGTPIAHRFEIWSVDSERDALVFEDGYCVSGTDLTELHKDKFITRGMGRLGEVWRSGRPVITEQNSVDPAGRKLVTLPLIRDAKLQSIVTLLL
jgi:hypothetical protein